MHKLDISGRVSTGDPNLACALLTNGLPLDESNPCHKVKSDSGDYLRFNFLPHTINGKQAAGELIAAWEAGQRHIDRFPDDGMAYCMAYSMNRKNLLDYIKQEVPQVLVRRGGQIALISENAGPRLESEILGRLK